MSNQLIARSPDLLQLRNEGYDITIVGGYLLVRDVPYVDSTASVNRGTLVSQLDLSGDKAAKPSTHVAYWIGEHPCHFDGTKIEAFQNASQRQNFGNGIWVDHTFSAKADYRDYYHKMITYIGRITGEAAKLDPTVTAQTYPVIPEENNDQVFKYVDTASSRANISALSERLAGQRIGIVGLGGTGAYVLDFVAKTWVAEIHLFDGDVFSQHNAFRSPGAPSLAQLEEKPHKVIYHAGVYDNMRNGIVIHDAFLNESNVTLLDDLDFVFLCLDQGSEKHLIVDRLFSLATPFIDVGMGLRFTEDQQLIGLVRSVISTPENRDESAKHISYDEGLNGNDEYATNIQIAELNALNAALAVIQWKKYCGVYFDFGGQYYAGYSVTSGEIASEGAV
jgi:hypothetical protein